MTKILLYWLLTASIILLGWTVLSGCEFNVRQTPWKADSASITILTLIVWIASTLLDWEGEKPDAT